MRDAGSAQMGDKSTKEKEVQTKKIKSKRNVKINFWESRRRSHTEECCGSDSGGVAETNEV